MVQVDMGKSVTGVASYSHRIDFFSIRMAFSGRACRGEFRTGWHDRHDRQNRTDALGGTP